ncbi:MAG: excinuclease ABC subunit UvrA [bacterium]
MKNEIVIKGARENNLKNISINLPKNKFIVMTGVSGSGKSSLAFDTIYAEGQRRYVESLSAYARQFVGVANKPEIDSIEGLSPSISIDQKTTNKNPRSTVGTITEIYDYLRLLYARIGVPYCVNHHEPIFSQSIEEMTNKIMSYEGVVTILSPIIRSQKGTHKDQLDKMREKGFTKIRFNNEILKLSDEIKFEKNKKEDIDLVVDKISISDEERSRVFEAIEMACSLSGGKILVLHDNNEYLMSESYACPLCDYSIGELEPRMFSFNSPYGACPECKGIGSKQKINVDLIIPNKDLSINQGAIVTQNAEENNTFFTLLRTAAKFKNINLDIPVKDMKKVDLDIILYGFADVIEVNYKSKNGGERKTFSNYEGVVNHLERRYIETASGWIRDWIEGFMVESTCSVCGGKRLNDSILSIYIHEKNIYDLCSMPIDELCIFFDKLKLTKTELDICNLVLKEIKSRLSFLNNVGLSYLTLHRNAATLSGGEAQRIRLATQIGSRLTGVLYVLDEPSIGLHQKDNEKLINSLKEMRDLGNTLVVVEHDEDTMLAADYLVDIGPGAGEFGGEIIAFGTPEEVLNNENSLTGKYLSGKCKIEIPSKRRKGNGTALKIVKAEENNLKKVNVDIPLGKFVCVTGVSGSGKSTLVNEILVKYLRNKLFSNKELPGRVKEIKNIDLIDKVVVISQEAIGRTPRSNPATYTGVFDEIRNLFASMKEAKLKGYGPGKFSFNVKGGRCEACQGDGVKKIEMHFLPDVYVACDVCGGKRYNKETLEVKYKGKNIHDVLDMRVSEALRFFENVPKVYNKLKVLDDVGLSYLKLGQSAPTLSGGEAGRVKLAKELQKKPTGKSIFILDEPTTGLHFEDVRKLLIILNRIVDNGDTVLVIEHNLDVVKVADHIIDLGPGGGTNGGTILVTGTPEKVAEFPESFTGEFLKKML